MPLKTGSQEDSDDLDFSLRPIEEEDDHVFDDAEEFDEVNAGFIAKEIMLEDIHLEESCV